MLHFPRLSIPIYRTRIHKQVTIECVSAEEKTEKPLEIWYVNQKSVSKIAKKFAALAGCENGRNGSVFCVQKSATIFRPPSGFSPRSFSVYKHGVVVPQRLRSTDTHTEALCRIKRNAKRTNSNRRQKLSSVIQL